MNTEQRLALEHAKQTYLGEPNVTGVGFGLRMRADRLTEDESIVVLVGQKFATREDVRRAGLAPVAPTIMGVPVDVQQSTPVALSLTGRYRPVRPGGSIGHVSITAGTLGFVARTVSGETVAVSNNHVFAASNAAPIGSRIVQPGPADGGFSSSDTVGQLHNFFPIEFRGSGGGGKKNALPARAYWATFRSPANFFARLVGCPYELTLRPRAGVTRGLAQPTPNRVDVATATPLLASYDPRALLLDRAWASIQNLALGDRVEKVGRTTEHTVGTVAIVEADISVNYGSSGVADFSGQVGIRADRGEFSAGGDSGSAIWHISRDSLGGLLYAGGDGVTFVNQIEDVFRLMQLQTTP